MIQIGAPASTLDTPVEHLVACHRRIEQRLETLVKAAALLHSDRERALEAIDRAIQFLDSSGVLHTEDEEHSVFPRLRPKLSPSDLAFIESLETDHQKAEAIFVDLKHVVADVRAQDPASADLTAQYAHLAEDLRSLYRAHIQSEDETLMKLASRALTDSDLQCIASEMRQRRHL